MRGEQLRLFGEALALKDLRGPIKAIAECQLTYEDSSSRDYCEICGEELLVNYTHGEHGTYKHAEDCALMALRKTVGTNNSDYEYEVDLMDKVTVAAEAIAVRRRDAGLRDGPYSVSMEKMDTLYEAVCDLAEWRRDE